MGWKFMWKWLGYGASGRMRKREAEAWRWVSWRSSIISSLILIPNSMHSDHPTALPFLLRFIPHIHGSIIPHIHGSILVCLECFYLWVILRYLTYKRTCRMPKNITNGEFIINYNEEDRVDDGYKFMRAPNTDSIELLKNQSSKTPINYYIENIRTGEFTQISESYMLESAKEKSDEPAFTTSSFETEMKVLFLSLQEKMNKGTTFFQGIYVGMALLYTITLNLSGSVSSDLVRVEDQAIRIVSILSSFGSIYSFLIASQRYDFIKLRGLSAQIDIAYKSLVLCTVEMIFYTISYVIYNVSHTYAVKYNISKSNYSELSQTTTAYTVLCSIAWIITNVNTYKYQNH